MSPQSTDLKITLGKVGRHRPCSIDKSSKTPTNSSYQCRRRAANHPIIIRRISEVIRFQLRTPLASSELPGGRPNRKIIVKRCPVIVNFAPFNPSRSHQIWAPLHQFATAGPASKLPPQSSNRHPLNPPIEPSDPANLPIIDRSKPRVDRSGRGDEQQVTPKKS